MIKERKLLLSSSIISIIYSILMIVFSFINNKDGIDVFNTVMNIVVILSSCLFMYYSSSKVDLEKKKTLIFVISILLFVDNIIGGVLGFIVYSKINKKSMRELPKLEIEHNYKWYVYLIVFIIWALIMFWVSNYFTNKIQSVIMYIVFVVMVSFVFRKDIIRDFKYFIKYFKEYSSLVLKMYGKSLVVLLILSISIRLYTGLDTSGNQESLNTLFSSKPVVVAILATLYAPFVEELLFRGVFRKFINNKWLFIITSGVLFGIAHMIDNFKNLDQLLFVFVYSSLGCFLAATYYKTNNVFTNIMFHFIQNALALIGMIIVTYYSDLLLSII